MKLINRKEGVKPQEMIRWRRLGLGITLSGIILAWIAFPLAIQITHSAKASSRATTIHATTFSLLAATPIPTPGITPTPTLSPSDQATIDLANATERGPIIAAIIAGVGGVGGAILGVVLTIFAEDRRNRNQERKEKYEETISNQALQIIALTNENTTMKTTIEKLTGQYQGSSIPADQISLYEQLAKQYITTLLNQDFFARVDSGHTQIGIDSIYRDIKMRPLPGNLPFELDKRLQGGMSVDALLEAQSNILEEESTTAQNWQSILNASPESRRFLLVGNVGSGKTTLLKHLAVKAKEYNLPELSFYIELKDFANSPYYTTDLNAPVTAELIDPEILKELAPLPRRLIGFIASKVESYEPSFHRNEAGKYIHQEALAGRALFLFDALERITSDEPLNSRSSIQKYRFTIETINQLSRKYNSSYVIVTASEATFYSTKRAEILFQFFDKLEVLNLSKNDIDAYIDTLPYQPLQMKTLKENLRQNIRLQSLASNTWFLAEIAYVAADTSSELHTERKALYRQFIEILLSSTNEDQNTKARKRNFLQKLAWQLHQHNLWYFTEDDLRFTNGPLRDLVEREEQNTLYFQGADIITLIDELLIQHNVLKQLSTDRYSFSYLCFQEYCASEYVAAHGGNATQELLEHRGDLWWNEVILLYEDK